jgi:HK97 family phage major capsid protein
LTADDKKDFRSLFGAPGQGWQHRDMTFLEALCSGRAHPGLNERRGMSEGDNQAGGFLVPNELAETVHNVSVGQELVLPRCNVIRMSGASIEVPAFAISDMSSSLFGGFTASWTGETGTMTDANPTTRSMNFVAKKLTGFVRLSNELFEDIGRRSNDLLNVIGQGLSWYRDKYLLTGDGVGKPLGIKNSPCAIEIPKETGQAADTIVYENLVKMLSRMHPAGVNRCVWVCHPSCLPQLLSLSISLGTGGSHIPVLTATSGKYECLTRPLVLSEHMSVVGDVFDIALIDFSQYAVALRSDLHMNMSAHTYFNTDELAIRLISRFDGQSLWDQAMTLPDGVTTVSPVVTLAAR